TASPRLARLIPAAQATHRCCAALPRPRSEAAAPAPWRFLRPTAPPALGSCHPAQAHQYAGAPRQPSTPAERHTRAGSPPIASDAAATTTASESPVNGTTRGWKPCATSYRCSPGVGSSSRLLLTYF